MFPFIPIAQGIYIPTYFMVISLTYMVCTYWLYVRALKFHLSQKYTLDLCLIIMLSGFLGGRLFHVFYEHPDYYSRASLEALKFWQGGFVFYGGLLFSAVSSLFYLQRKNQDIRRWMDLMAPVVVFGYILGRLATLLSGSGYGRPTDLPWAIVYPPGPEAPAGIPLHPTPIYSMLWNGAALIFIFVSQKKNYDFFQFSGSYLLAYGVYHALGRWIVEQFRDDFRGGAFLGFSISSWLSLLLMLFCSYYFVYFSRKSKSQK